MAEPLPTRNENRPRIGLALGGGGARGLAHVGVLKALDRAGLEPDVVAGTSMGGLIGGAYAAGFSGQAIEREVLELTTAGQLVRLADRVPTLRALFSGKRFEEYLRQTLGADLSFEALHRPLAVSTVDLNEKREIVYTSGPVIPALRATMSIPGIFASVERDGRRLVDGGILNNVPANLARGLGADIVVAVDVLAQPNDSEEHDPASLDDLPVVPAGLRDLWESVFISIGALSAYNLAHDPPDLIIRPIPPPHITVLTGYMSAEDAIEVGEETMEAALPELMRLLDASHDMSPAEPLPHAPR